MVEYDSAFLKSMFPVKQDYKYFFIKDLGNNIFHHIKYNTISKKIESSVPYKKEFISQKNFGIDLSVLLKLANSSNQFKIGYNSKLGGEDYTIVPLKVSINGCELYIAPIKIEK